MKRMYQFTEFDCCKRWETFKNWCDGFNQLKQFAIKKKKKKTLYKVIILSKNKNKIVFLISKNCLCLTVYSAKCNDRCLRKKKTGLPYSCW